MNEKEAFLEGCKSKVNPAFDHLYEDTPSLFKLVTKEEFEEWAGVTTGTRLRELLEQASNDLDIYKKPNLSELTTILPEVVRAANLGSISGTIIRIVEAPGYFEIETSWSARCCEQSSYIHLPSFIVDSKDPIKTAKTWANKIALEEVEDKIKSLEKTLKDLYVKREALTSCG